MLTIVKDLWRQAMHNVSKLVHTDKCPFYTDRIDLASSSKELHQIVNTLSNTHPPKILPTIYPSTDLSLFMRHFTNKVEKPRAALLQNMLPQHLLLAQLLQLSLHLKKCCIQQWNFFGGLLCYVTIIPSLPNS